ncbi:MAG: hypothetical protein AB1679_30040, partial [Actinomycetota bacterium]
MTRKSLRVGGLVVALCLAAACGVKPSVVRDQEASDRLRPHEITADFSGEAGSVVLETPGGEAAPAAPTGESTPPAPLPVAGSEGPGAGAVAVSGPAAPSRSSAPGPAVRAAASSQQTAPPSGSPAPEAAPVMGPPAPSPRPPAPPREPEPSDPPPAPAPPREAFEGQPDRTGVTDTTIRIGIHAPVTGAAPFPQSAFEQSNNLYWKFLAEKGGVHGRNVE